MSPIETFLSDSDLFFSGKNFWQAGLFEQISPLNAEQALWRPFEKRHCIWEYVRHINFWKEWAIIYVKEGKKLNAKEHNWEKLPDDVGESSWQSEIEKTKMIQNHFNETAKSIGDKMYSSDEESIKYFRQVLLHDAYHCGQIGLMRAMQGIKSVT